MRARRPLAIAAAGGFTLVEILIVIAAIGILAGLALQVIPMARERNGVAVTKIDIANLTNAASHYEQDEGEYPGQRDFSGGTNQFPLLYNALFGERRPKGPGGRSAPYMTLVAEKVFVYDGKLDGYRPARRRELFDPEIDKFMLDSWGNPLIYRVNKGRPLDVRMYNRHGFDLYSIGPDGIDQTLPGEDRGDDIGNW